ncbi:MAG: DNA repair protein RadA [Armatimonadota bacterium]|nr:DNA repair protein RadA [Armatimonadota bacterium]
MAKTQTKYVCQQCGYESPKWLGRCPDCNEWNTLVEEVVTRTSEATKKPTSATYNPPKPITDVVVGEHHRYTTGIGEFDRVLGGGVVPGSVVLVGGDPGIGKSTLLTQVAENLSREGPTLYVSGEESLEQVKMRANRLGAVSERLYLAAETCIEQVEAYVQSLKPGAVIIDSIQAMYDSSLESAPATVSQVRSCTATLVRIAKGLSIPVFIIGHVTKDGSIAGPRVLEHMVDTVLYFEGDRHQVYRILRAVKNRFGSTDELGIFEMHENGLVEVSNPSELLLAERPLHGPGSVVSAVIEGTRPLLVEVQALVSPSYFAAPRRMVSGVDYNRTMLILAVLEKRIGLRFSNQDVYVSIAGGVKAAEPALDLAIAAAVASNLKELPIDPKTLVVGEVGLAGEVRGVVQIEKRIREAAHLGFERAIIPAANVVRAKVAGMKTVGVESVYQGIEAAIGSFKRKRATASAIGERDSGEGEKGC